MNQLPLTPSQTVGPFFAYGLTARQYGYDYTSLLNEHLTCPDTNRAEHIVITGRIFDGAGNAVNDAMIELWQGSGASGAALRQSPAEPLEYPHKPGTFRGYGRLGTGTTADNRFTFTTVKPGRYAGAVDSPSRLEGPGGEPRIPGVPDAPHINVILLMRGSLRTLYTRLYFSDEAQANAQDPLLSRISTERQQTLIAKRTDAGQYQFDIYLQGPNETVFFDL